jgi:lactoylglutathione lyase
LFTIKKFIYFLS